MQATGTVKRIFDTMYGTRQYTEGAQLQLPRKVPMRVEPKSYFGELCFGAASHSLTGLTAVGCSFAT